MVQEQRSIRPPPGIIKESEQSFAFVVEEPALAVETAAVAGQRTIRANDAVAGDDDRDGVGAVGEAYSADGRRTTDVLRDFAVRSRGAAWDSAERAPYILLKVCADGLHRNRVDSVEVCGEVALESSGETVGIIGAVEAEAVF